MQGTVKDFDDPSRTGTLLQDDRTEVRIDPMSLEGAGIRTLRLGQRVRFRLVEEGGAELARELRIVTFE
jgi:cold shock CspA family protein